MEGEMLSDELIELYSSFGTNSECDLSFDKTPSKSLCTSNDYNYEKSFNSDTSKSFYSKFEVPFSSSKSFKMNSLSKNFEVSVNRIDNDIIENDYVNDKSCFKTQENHTEDLIKTFDFCVSLNPAQFPDSSKAKEFKRTSVEVNDAYVKFFLSQFLIDSYKSVSHQVTPELGRKVNDLLTDSTLRESSVMKSKSGEDFSLLGLDYGDFADCVTLSVLEKKELNNQLAVTLKTKVQLLKSRKSVLNDMFGVHCQRVSQADSMVSEERVKLAKLYSTLQSQLSEASQMLVMSNQMMQQLSHTVKDCERDLQVAQVNSLLDKAKYLQTAVSTLLLKTEQSLYRDKQQMKAVNGLGSKLKCSVDDAKEQLKSLKKRLAEYERKEAVSIQYRELVSNYSKTKRQLNHKLQTLSVLNDPNISF